MPLIYNPYNQRPSNQEPYRGYSGAFGQILRRHDDREQERQWNATEYICTLDLGQVNDYSALTILEPKSNRLQVRKIARLPLNMPYPDQVRFVQGVLSKLPSKRSLIVDHTGVGRPVFDMFKEAGLPVVGITLTGGEKVVQLMTKDKKGRLKPRQEFRCPKNEVVSSLFVCMQKKRLAIPQTVDHIDLLKQELRDFQAQARASGHVSFAAKEGSKDDLILSLSLGCWWWLNREKYMRIESMPMIGRAEHAAMG